MISHNHSDIQTSHLILLQEEARDVRESNALRMCLVQSILFQKE